MNNDNLVPVKGKTGLYRDSNTTAIVNKDQISYKSYMSRKKVADSKTKELDQMKEDLDNVKSELGDIKSLLSTIVQKLNN
tara:strand:- start:10 stop:249 length:240 start_codon:yes stop_codon:yes gene_type:complete